MKLSNSDEKYLAEHPNAKIVEHYDPFFGTTHIVLRNK